MEASEPDMSMSMTATIATAPGAGPGSGTSAALAPPSAPYGGETVDTAVLGVHRGAIDQTTITTRAPGTVMAQIDAILHDMGVAIQKEGTFKYRCVRPQKGAGAVHLDSPRVSSPDYIDSPTAEFETRSFNYSSLSDSQPVVLYGAPADDSMAEVRFSVELTKLAGLKGTYSLDIRRLKGNLKSYSFIYNTIRERAELNH